MSECGRVSVLIRWVVRVQSTKKVLRVSILRGRIARVCCECVLRGCASDHYRVEQSARRWFEGVEEIADRLLGRRITWGTRRRRVVFEKGW